ncbi:DUF6359 domain-containing protein [Paenibacillus sp. YYML68]|uniref:DUF6359 domain-containing protein n=1 Tax=Paenibacillus sp. YYML68 TaxID=2909250 RepID=UPI0037C84C33
MRTMLLRKWSCIVMAMVLAMSGLFGYAPSTTVAASADGTLTVAEVIAANNNNSVSTVEGFIVGHATGSMSANFKPSFSNDFNILIADKSGEQDKSKLVNIQLSTTADRNTFGLKTNPTIIGKKVKVTGTLTAYNSFPGVKSIKSIAFVSDTPPPEPGIVSISSAKSATGTVKIAGIVTADNAAIGGGKLSTFVQDATGGINIFSQSTAGFPDLKEGDQVEVTGSITSYKGLTEIVPTSIIVQASNQTLPAPISLTVADLQSAATAEAYEGQLVKLTAYFKTVPATPAGGGYNIQAVDAQYAPTTVRVVDGSINMSGIQQDKWYDVVGILGQYDSYQVIPRKNADLVLSANQPPLYPTNPTEYEATVERIVDGDTIVLTSSVLGATNVRFLNIDTPESDDYIRLNGGVKTPADQNHLDYGLAAKQYMGTLLQPGDQVVLKVGAEAIDSYGRLLAQVVRKSDGLNVNLEMVNKGHAVTYFIWPIGTVEEYNMYQAAVKTAKDQGLGIWSATNPLQELPFVFRARLSGAGLTRPVGHSDTKVYVDKEQWATVPVEKRIFFNTEQDAISNGYVKFGQVQPTPLPDGTGKKVLFDNTHGQTAGAADWVIDGAFSDFADGLRGAGFTVESLERTIPYTFGEQAITLEKLQGYDVFVIAEANIPFKTSEQAAMVQYVQGGGSIFFISDHYNADRNKNRWDSSEAMNGYRRGAWTNPAKGMSAEEASSPAMQDVVSSDWLAQNFGVRFRFNSLGDVDHMTDVVAPNQTFGITQDVGSLSMHAGSTLAIIDPAKAKGLVYPPAPVSKWAHAVDSGVYNGGGRAEGPYAAVAKLGAGKAAFIGDSSPVEDATPKYLREENGSKKTTYNGFKAEADNDTFLVQTVRWLAHRENYSSLTQVAGLQLDQPTQLHAYEQPAQTTEPQPEPWAAPSAGYKWYDPSTFKSGSYGSSQQPPVQAQYSFLHQSTLPNAVEFQIRVKADKLLPGQTVSGLSAGIYLPGGTQVAKIRNEDGTWPSSYGYSSSFSITADALGRGYKDLTVQMNPSASGAASLRLKANGNNEVTNAVTIGNVPAEPLPADKPPVPEKTSIANVRLQPDDAVVTVEGIITSEPGAFGSQAFYMQDDTAGIYVYQATAGFRAGDKIKISAKKTTYNNELELIDPIVIEKVGTAPIPAAIVQTELNESNQGELVKLEKVTIQNYITATPAGSFEFDVISSTGSTHVRVDARTGISMTEFQSKYPAGAVVNITGISAIFKTTYQLKPLAMSAVEPATIMSKAPSASSIAVVNHKLPMVDEISVSDVTPGDVIKVYDAPAAGSLLGSASADSSSTTVTMHVYQLGQAAGTIYVTVTSSGMVESERTAKAYDAEPADQLAPVTKYRMDPIFAKSKSGAQYVSGFNISLKAEDNAGGSGVKTTQYRINGGAWKTYTGPFTATAGTTQTVEYYSEDNAGNVENPVNKMDFMKGTFTGAGSY